MTTTFTHIASKSAKKSKKPRVLKAQFGDGYAQRAPDGINTSPETWALSFNDLPDFTADSIEDFLEATKGTEPFYWTNPRGVTNLYTCPEWERTHIKDGLSSITTKFEQYYG